jgi:hypothetical protein
MLADVPTFNSLRFARLITRETETDDGKPEEEIDKKLSSSATAYSGHAM